MKSKKAPSRVTSANQETAAAAGAASRSTKRKAIGSAAVENVAKRQFEKTASRAVQAHTRASGQRQQARRDSRLDCWAPPPGITRLFGDLRSLSLTLAPPRRGAWWTKVH
jgi:hypothetical protein